MNGKVLRILVSSLLCFVVNCNGDIKCQIDENDPCKYKLSGNVTGIVDFSPVFSDGPLQVTSRQNGVFLYDACIGLKCDPYEGKCRTDTCAACQKMGILYTYGLGDITTVSCDASQSDPSKNNWTIVLSYTGGTDNRESNFTFKYTPNNVHPVMNFNGEIPPLHYHLTVYARFPVPGGQTISCYPSPESPCKCTLVNGATGTIDLSPLFSNGPLTTISGNFYYNYSCKGVQCSGAFGTCSKSGPCAGCMVSRDGKQTYGLGAVSSVSFDVSRSKPKNGVWIVKATYGSGYSGRAFSATIVFNEIQPSPYMAFAGEDPITFYHLDVMGKFTVPKSPYLKCKPIRESHCRCLLSNGAVGTIDLSPLFSQGMLSNTSDHYAYYYDACHGLSCGVPYNTTANYMGPYGACQQVSSTEKFALGNISTVSFDVSKSDPSTGLWIVILSYTGGTEDRRFDVVFTLAPRGSIEFNFLEENPKFDFHMFVKGNFEVPENSKKIVFSKA